ncbi:MAG: DUF6788 family protein [Candidatus Helarchaeota archaeon]
MLTEITLKDKEIIELLSQLENTYISLKNKRKELVLQIKDSESGILMHEYIRCGKKNCKCYNGGALHGPYWYHYYWENGKLKKRYICPVRKPNAKFQELYNKIENNKQNKQIQRQIKEIDNKLIKIENNKKKIKNELRELLKKIQDNK